MPAPQQAPLPPFFSMGDGMQIVVTAIDAATGATVSGVVVSGVSFSVDPAEGSSLPDIVPPILDPAYFEGQEP